MESQHVQKILDSLSTFIQHERRETDVQHIHAEICLLDARGNHVECLVMLGKNCPKLETLHREVERKWFKRTELRLESKEFV